MVVGSGMIDVVAGVNCITRSVAFSGAVEFIAIAVDVLTLSVKTPLPAAVEKLNVCVLDRKSTNANNPKAKALPA